MLWTHTKVRWTTYLCCIHIKEEYQWKGNFINFAKYTLYMIWYIKLFNLLQDLGVCYSLHSPLECHRLSVRLLLLSCWSTENNWSMFYSGPDVRTTVRPAYTSGKRNLEKKKRKLPWSILLNTIVYIVLQGYNCRPSILANSLALYTVVFK